MYKSVLENASILTRTLKSTHLIGAFSYHSETHLLVFFSDTFILELSHWICVSVIGLQQPWKHMLLQLDASGET